MRINDRSKTDFDRAKIKLTGHFDRRPTGRYFEPCCGALDPWGRESDSYSKGLDIFRNDSRLSVVYVILIFFSAAQDVEMDDNPVVTNELPASREPTPTMENWGSDELSKYRPSNSNNQVCESYSRESLPT